jgi:hypothetical protein
MEHCGVSTGLRPPDSSVRLSKYATGAAGGVGDSKDVAFDFLRRSQQVSIALAQFIDAVR